MSEHYQSEQSREAAAPGAPTQSAASRRTGRSRTVTGLTAAGLAVAFAAGAATQGLGWSHVAAAQTSTTPIVAAANSAVAAAAPVGPVAAIANQVGPAVVSVRTDQGLGSGVIYDPSGLILTNAHVVSGAQSITVGLVDGRHFNGTVVGADTGFDVAVIKIDGSNLPTATLGDSASLQVGDSVIAIGNPYGFDHTLTTGVVSGLNRPVSEGQGSYNQPMIQTDAAINPGNSGGPLLDGNGQVVGITTLVAAPQGIPAQGLGFAVPVDTATRIATQLVQSGKVSHSGMPFLGVSLGDINRPTAIPGLGTPGQRRTNPTPQLPSGVDHGALVGDVQPGSAAAQAGLQANDVITSFDGFDIYNPDELLQRLVLHKPGDQVNLSVVRGGQSMNLSLTVGEAPVQS